MHGATIKKYYTRFIIGKTESLPYEVRSKVHEQFIFISIIKVLMNLFFGDSHIYSLPLKNDVFEASHK